MYVEEQAFGDRQWFRPASERQRYQLQAKQHSPRLIKRTVIATARFTYYYRTVAAFVGSQIRPLLPDSGIRAARNGQSFAKYAPSAFTDEVNCIIDNEKQKALLVVGVRSPRACVTMSSAANQ